MRTQGKPAPQEWTDRQVKTGSHGLPCWSRDASRNLHGDQETCMGTGARGGTPELLLENSCTLSVDNSER